MTNQSVPHWPKCCASWAIWSRITPQPVFSWKVCACIPSSHPLGYTDARHDCIELQEKLLKLRRKTPIIFVSGQSHPHQIVQGLKKGAVDFLFKPFNLEELLKAVADAVDFDSRQLKRVF